MATRAEWIDLIKTLQLDNGKEGNVLDSLRQSIYPIDGLLYQDVEPLVVMVTTTPIYHTSDLVIKWSQILHNLIKIQNLAPPTDSACNLLFLLISLLPSCFNQCEPLYAISSLMKHAQLTPKVAEGLLVPSGPLVSITLSSKAIPTQRASLDCISSILLYVDVSPLVLNEMLELLFQLLNSSVTKPLLQDHLHLKLQISLLRVFHQSLGQMASLQPLPFLPSLLATLKVAMTTGLPGHTVPRTLQPVSPHPSAVTTPGSPQSSNVAGSRQKRTKRKPRPPNQSDHASITNEEDKMIAGWRTSNWSCWTSSGSESEPSDSDTSSANLKELNQKIRIKSLTCLSVIFQTLDRNTAFSYGLLFLPDVPRPPSSPPNLHTCLCKDPSYKCRSAAASLLINILEGSKSFLAVADNQPVRARPFTPYSATLGSVIKELHRMLLLAVTAEPHSTTLTQIIKCLSVLTNNVPYHQLSSQQYISRILTTLQPITTRHDVDVAVGCLTCYGNLLSLGTPHREVEVWLRGGASSDWPWVVNHCTTLLEDAATGLSLKIEAIQLITNIVKFYFSIIRCNWRKLSDLYINCLSSQQEPLQPHALKFLEELGRVLGNELSNYKEIDLMGVVSHWEHLLSGSLVGWLQSGHTHPVSCSHASSVLAVIGDTVLQNIQTSLKVLVLTLILGLSKDENISIKATAIHTLGVFCQYSSLIEDFNFLIDCSGSIVDGCQLKEHLNVRCQSSWALGNLTDSLIGGLVHQDVVTRLFPSLGRCVLVAMGDVEKVKVNAVRAGGNLLRIMSDEVYRGNKDLVKDLCSLLGSCINAGVMKTRWNACYACYNAFSNEKFIQNCEEIMVPLVNELCVAVVSCKNFKVRANSALALGGPTHYPAHQPLPHVWTSILSAIKNSDYSPDFIEYRQTNTLRQQLSCTFCKLILMMETIDVILDHPPSDDVMKLLQQTIREVEPGTVQANLIEDTIERLNLPHFAAGRDGDQWSNIKQSLVAMLACYKDKELLND